MPFGPYGQDPYGQGTDSFPAAPTSFSARPGMQGPQIVLTWGAPAQPNTKLMIRRKQGEFPRDTDDGVLVLLDEENPDERTYYADLGADLIPEDSEAGEGAWWYYRMFVEPAPLPLEDQIIGLAVQSTFHAIATTATLVDGRAFDVYLEHTGGGFGTPRLETAPESSGPWASVQQEGLDPDEVLHWHVAGGLAYVRVRDALVVPAPTSHIKVSICVDVDLSWQTGPALCAVVYAFKTGRHIAAAALHLPEDAIIQDASIDPVSLVEDAGEGGEVFNLGETGRSYGPLARTLMVYLAEFDQVDAYLRAVRAYAADVDSMPAYQFVHVAEMLGYPLEVDGRNFDEVRAEIFRIAGVWKLKGTTRLVRATAAQLTGLRPRVQEGAGRVFRIPDPDLYGRIPSQSLHGIGG